MKTKSRIILLLIFVLTVTLGGSACTKNPPEDFRKLTFMTLRDQNICYHISDLIDFVPNKSDTTFSWEKVSDDKWIYRVDTFDHMKEKKTVFKFLFARTDGANAEIKSILSDGQTIEGLPLQVVMNQTLSQFRDGIAKGMQAKKAIPVACSSSPSAAAK